MAKVSGRTRGNGPSSNPQLKGAGNTERQTEHPGNQYSYHWESEAKDYIMKKGGMSSSEADETFAIIQSWAGSGFKGMRDFQLGRDNSMEIVQEHNKKGANIMENFIERMPKWAGGTTYRGMDVPQKRAFFDSLDVGDTWEARSLNSWTTDFFIGKEFARESGGDSAVILRCFKPQNGTSIRNLGGLRRESEVVTSGKCRYRCLGKTVDSDGTLIVDLEPISNGKVRKG